MAVRTAESSARDARRAWFVAASLVVLFVVALFLRAYWNLDAAHPEEGTFLLSGGSDPYYHKHAVDAILDDSDGQKFQTLVHDPLLNYPYGSINPNPPLFQWTAAVVGSMLSGFFGPETAADGTTLSAEQVSTWWVFLWLPAIFGALTLIPIYFIGRTLFDWRVGLVAAALWAFSTSAIDGTGLGLSDHDAMLMFFAVCAFLFYIKTIVHFRGDGNWVTNWRDGRAVSTGIGRLYRERSHGFAYALLTGMSIAAVALVWKGFPYVVGIIFLYAILQMVIDHWRNRDSTGLFLATTIALLVGTLVAYPYYAMTGLEAFITPVFYVIAALVVAGLILVPTRDLPSILVLPIAAVAGLLLLLVAVLVLPNVAQKLLSATVYFKQTTLYTTIAEAQPADFSTIAFGIGPVPFLLGLAAWFILLFNLAANRSSAIVFSAAWLTIALLTVPLGNWNETAAMVVFLIATFAWLATMAGGSAAPAQRAHLFALVWAGMALFMAASAVRFLFNAIPAFAVFGAFMIVWVIDWLDFGVIKRNMAGAGWAGFRKGLRPMHVVGVVLIALFLVLPNAMLAADAALPRSSEVDIAQKSGEDSFTYDVLIKRFGAYGQNFLDSDWQGALGFLDQHDTGVAPAERGAFLSWWDYGHWAISVGNHPAVADNFQNGYEFAAEFLLAQNETHAVQLFAARLLPLVQDETRANQIVADAGAADGAAARQSLIEWGYVEDLTLEESVDLVLALEQETGKKIRYFATDIRMMPLDDPNTPGLSTASNSQWEEQTSIFYAPVTLAEREGDDYVAIKIDVGSSTWITQDEFTERASNPVGSVQAIGERLEYKEPFFNSMYYRAFVGTPVETEGRETVLGNEVFEALVCALPGYGLEHFRLVYANRGVKILEFTPGAVVTGTVSEEGAATGNVTVTAYDDAGQLLTRPAACPAVHTATGSVPHASTTTDASGAFTLRAPFALDGNITLVASRGDVTLGTANVTGLTRDAVGTDQEFTADITVQKGSVAASVFEDLNGDAVFQPDNETALDNLTISVGGVTGTTDADGNVTLTGVPGGEHVIEVDSEQYELVNPNARVRVQPGETATQVSVAVREKGGTLQGRLLLDDGTPADANTVIRVEPVDPTSTARATSAFVSEGGWFNATLRPGTYMLNITGFTDVTPETVTIAPGETTDVVEFTARPEDG